MSNLKFLSVLLLWTFASSSSSWHEVYPRPLTYCPSSPLGYDCLSQQSQVWNAPSLAHAPLNPSIDGSPLLVIFLAGTGSTPHEFQNGVLKSWVAFGKAHVLGQSYVSAPYPVSDMNMLCGDENTNGGDSVAVCLSRFHNAVVFGNSSSPLFGLHSSDSIEQRILSSLQVLHSEEPENGWDLFYIASGNAAAALLWTRIIISGHSQGGGHAAFVGHKRLTAQVVLLSSPQDCCSYSTFTSLPWLTPLANVSALYHLHEDARGTIARAVDQLTQGTSPAVEFKAPFSPPVNKTTSSRVFYSVTVPQATCPCSSRMEHCSTATDACAPISSTTSSKECAYEYHQLWQYLAFGEYL